MSLKSSEIACSSIRKMPTHMIALIGQISGRQRVGLRWLYSIE